MSGGKDLALEVHGAVAERGRRLARTADQRRGEILGPDHAPHPTSAAAGRGLDEQRKADAFRGGDDVGDLVRTIEWRGLQRARHGRNVDTRREPTRIQLVAQRLDRGGRRPDEDQPGLLHRPGERGAFGEEPVPGMDRLGTRGERGVDDGVDQQVALARRRRTEADGDIRHAHVGGLRVRVRVDGHRLHAQLVAGADDADGDLPAVGDEDSTERRRVRQPAAPAVGVCAQRREPRPVRAGCCHASSGGSCPACPRGSPARG